MGVEIILKIAAVGILTAIVSQILKLSQKDDIAMLTTLAGVIVVLFMIIDLISSLFGAVRNLFNI